MGSSENFPASRTDSSATAASVAELFAGVSLPTIVPLSSDIAVLSLVASLPRLPDPAAAFEKTRGAKPTTSGAGSPACSTPLAGVPLAGGASDAGACAGSDTQAAEGAPIPECQLDVARTVWDDCAASLAAVRRLQNQSAAVLAGVVERFVSAAALESGILGFDPFQRQGELAQLQSEIAVIMNIPEGRAAQLIEHSTTLIRHLPTTMAALHEGSLGFEHATHIAEQTSLLRDAGIGQDTIDCFEQKLLAAAQGATMPSFREKARRLRERAYPETIAARTRKAFSDRNIRVERSFDGMSLLTLFAPNVTVEAIWNQCTSTAQAAQGPHESRTLTQLRADVAAALLLGQTMAENQIYTPTPPETGTPTINETGGSAGHPTTSTTRTGEETSTSATGDAQGAWAWSSEPDPCGGGAFRDPRHGDFVPEESQVPGFEDPDYRDPPLHRPGGQRRKILASPRHGPSPHPCTSGRKPSHIGGRGYGRCVATAAEGACCCARPCPVPAGVDE